MRSYHQYCAAARALDLIGDRWTLLIVRELLLRDCRFTDLRDSLPGIATNLLTERLRHLEAAGLLDRVEAPPPIATTLYRLTERGRALKPVLHELTRWGLPEMTRDVGDTARGHWAVGAIPLLFDDADLAGLAPLVVDLEIEGVRMALRVAAGTLDVGPPAGEGADVVVRGRMPQVMAALAGSADALGEIEVEGDPRRLRALSSRATFRP